MNRFKNRHRIGMIAVFAAVSLSLVGLAPSSSAAPSGPSLPCDTYGAAGTPCVAAHSTVRALYAAYSGRLYQVKRMSDSLTTDISTLSAGGYANAATQDSFCANTTCVITTLYDQSLNHNDLTIAPGGGAQWTPDSGADAGVLPLMVDGFKVYGLYISSGNGYRNNNTRGIAINGAPEGAYMVSSGQHFNNQCCFDYGNAETNNLDNGAGHMDALAYLKADCGGGLCPGMLPGPGPWAGVDMENGIFFGDNNQSWTKSCATLVMKNNGQTVYSLKVGDAVTGGLTTFAQDKPLPTGYAPMHQEGAIVLGIGGDNSNGSVGTFLEGAMTSGYPTNAAEDSVQSNITAAGYTLCDNAYTTVVPTSETTGQSWKYTTSTPPAGWQNTNFDDSGWNTGLGGFGAPGTPGMTIRTSWVCTNCDIWLRRHFNPGSLTATQRQNLAFRLMHDDDVSEIDINGVLAGVLPGYNAWYTYMSMTQAAQNAVVVNGDNVLALHVHQYLGGQSADAGIVYRTTQTNLALNQPVSASGAPCAPNEGPSNAVDGSLSTKWCSGLVNGVAWLQVDLGANNVYTVNAFTIDHAGAGGEDPTYDTRDFQIQASSDAITWFTYQNVVGNTIDINTFSIPNVGFRYYRLWITNPQTNPNNIAARIYEFQVLGWPN